MPFDSNNRVTRRVFKAFNDVVSDNGLLKVDLVVLILGVNEHLRKALRHIEVCV